MTPAQLLPIHAISVRQPWAWALFHGKHLENRTRTAVAHMHAVQKPRPGRPVRLCIHASKGMTRSEYEHGRATIDAILGPGSCPRPDELVRSAILGDVFYVDCIKQSTSPWFFGPYALVFERAKLLDAPVGCRGELGFFEWRDNLAVFGNAPNVAQLVQPDQPLPWMRKWRADPEQPMLEAPSYIKRLAPAPLFDKEQ